MTQRQMQYFIAVCECGNVTKAAEQLYVSRPVVSKVLRELEEEFGVSLFVRTSTGIRITEQGNSIRKFIEGYMNSYSQLCERVHESDSPGGSHFLRIGVAPTSIRWFFTSIYFPLKERHKDLKLFVSEMPAQESLDAIINGDVDFVISPRRVEDSPSLSAIKLYESELVFCASATSKYADCPWVDYDSITDLPMVMPYTGGDGIIENPVIFVMQADVMRMAVEHGDIYSVLPYEVTDGWEGVAAIPFKPKKPFIINLIWNNTLPNKKAFQTLMDFVKEKIDAKVWFIGDVTRH
ncbi:MAG: LysR family transcriptional regulator [Oscillospiraceae bacterium]|nr:LysR family transcriptional regulator [Oscillospiraceae bacterium]